MRTYLQPHQVLLMLVILQLLMVQFNIVLKSITPTVSHGDPLLKMTHYCSSLNTTALPRPLLELFSPMTREMVFLQKVVCIGKLIREVLLNTLSLAGSLLVQTAQEWVPAKRNLY